MPLTDVAVRTARPTEKTQRLFDGGGLYLEVAPSGGKWWRLKYRHLGKEKRLSLGTYPGVSLRQAREQRDEHRQVLQSGLDPSAERKAEKIRRIDEAEKTVEAIGRAWLEHMKPGWKANTREAVTASLERYVFAEHGGRPAASMTARDIRAAIKAVEASGAGDTAGRVFQRVRAMYRHAVTHDLVEVDPTYSLKAADILRPRKVQHRASLPLREVPTFLRNLDTYGGDPMTTAALRLLVLTAVRSGELRGACWSEIEGDLWRIPAERMKMQTEHLVPLSHQSRALLELVRPLSGRGALIFPSPYYPGKPLSENTFNSALARMGYKGMATAHGFRTLFSTAANEADWPGDVVERQLAHEERDAVRAAYNQAQYLPKRVELMQWWADKLDNFINFD